MNELVLGPLLRNVDDTSAAIWVEVSESGTVVVEAGEYRASARTFRVHGHHYALVCLEDLTPGSRLTYTVSVDGTQVWPAADAAYPPSTITTLDPQRPLQMLFGSCRTSVAHDEEGNRTHGVDALRAFSLSMMDDESKRPDLVLFLGDQVYADETTEAMQEFIESRRDINAAPWTELRDYEEYAHLYLLAWNDPANRWLLSTLPSAMIFDDHDIRDDWNTSLEWRAEMEATSWWHGRIVAGLASYWVYQHLGNMTPAERAKDEIWQAISSYDGESEVDVSNQLDAFADRVDQEPEYYRWSYSRDFGDQARLIVIDSRAARVLDPERRAMLDDSEMAWLDDLMQGDVQHLLVATSVPFLLAPGLHHVEAFAEALALGAWGRRGARAGEKIRQKGDLEHWGAFQSSFQKVSAMALEVARGERGRAPRTVTFLSGDVHHSYVSEARPRDGSALQSRMIQAVCSPIRNPLSRKWRFATAALSYGVAGPIGHVVALSAKVPRSPLQWRLVKGPWFNNNIASLEVTDSGLSMWWASGEVEKPGESPTLVEVASVELDG